MNKEIDALDKKIVNALLADADVTNRGLAKNFRVALGTINNRIHKLKSMGIIRKKTIIVDYSQLGYNIEVMIAIKIKKGGFHELAKKLAMHPNVFLVVDMTGDYDAEIISRFHNTRQLDKFVKDLQQNPVISATSTRLILNIYREKEIY